MPYWFRFWQCVKRQWKLGFRHKNKTQLWNTGKYFSKMLPSVVLMVFDRANRQNEDGSMRKGFALYFVIKVIATLYSLFWDTYNDWGLCRGKFLREKRTFKPIVYYVAVVENVLFRFFWLVPIWFYGFKQTTQDDEGNDTTPIKNIAMQNIDLLAFLGMTCEAIRRTYWAILRVENEFHNNFEQYRTINSIPSLVDENEK